MAEDFEKIPTENNEAARPKRRRKEPMAEQVHEITTRFKVEKPVSELDAPATKPSEPARPAAAAATSESEPETLDPVEQWLRQLDPSTAEWTVIVYRLVQYHSNGGRTDSKSGRVRLGAMPFVPSTYEAEIAAKYARPGLVNIFVAEVRKDGNYQKQLPVLFCEPPGDDEMLRYGVTPPAPSPLPTAAAAAQPFALPSLEDQLRQLKEFAKTARDLGNLFNPPGTVANTAAAPAGELTEEAALLKLLTADEESAARLRKKAIARLVGGDAASTEKNWADVVDTALQHGPAIVQEVGNLLMRFMNPAAAVTVAQPMPPQPQPQPSTDPAAILFQRVLSCAAIQMPADEAAHVFIRVEEKLRADLTEEQAQEFSEMVETFLATPPAEVCAQAAAQWPIAAQIVNQPHMPAWIGELQQFIQMSGNDEHSPNGLEPIAPDREN